MLQGLEMFGQALLGFMNWRTLLNVAVGDAAWASSSACCPASPRPWASRS